MSRVVVLGYGPMGIAITRGVLQSAAIAKLVGVLPWSFLPGKNWARQEAGERAFRQFLKQNRVPVLHTTSVNHYDFLCQLHALQPDLVLVGSWGEILKPHLLALPGCRFINCHPSLLPMHRGPNPYTASILAGDSYTGITFHEIDHGVDTGPILLQVPFSITPDDTGGSLRQRCATLAEETLPMVLEGVYRQTLLPISQPIGGSYESNPAQLGCIHWQSPPEILDRQFRACRPWIELMTQLGRHCILFREGRLIEVPATQQVLLPPGAIIRRHGSKIWVSTVDPAYHACLSHPQFGSLPDALSQLLAGLVLRPGKQFRSFT